MNSNRRMYIPAHFAESRPAALHAVMRAHSLATVVFQTAHGLDAHPLPLVLDLDRGLPGTLLGHVARSNPIWRDPPVGEVLAVFHGPQAYVSPSSYPSKAEHRRVVPTWNYVAVHARGELAWIDDAAWMRGFLTRLTQEHEAGLPKPWSINDAPAEYIDKLLGAVVGFELRLRVVEGKFKLSQNRSPEDFQGAAQTLGSQPNGVAIAEAMRALDRDR
jgi:transcriptional regulator